MGGGHCGGGTGLCCELGLLLNQSMNNNNNINHKRCHWDLSSIFQPKNFPRAANVCMRHHWVNSRVNSMHQTDRQIAKHKSVQPTKMLSNVQYQPLVRQISVVRGATEELWVPELRQSKAHQRFPNTFQYNLLLFCRRLAGIPMLNYGPHFDPRLEGVGGTEGVENGTNRNKSRPHSPIRHLCTL